MVSDKAILESRRNQNCVRLPGESLKVREPNLIVATLLISHFVLAGCSGPSSPAEVHRGAAALENVTKPNIVFIVADDLGFADIGSFGSEIKTPNIDSLAERGLLFTRFYAASACAPSRSMLLTGVDNHKTGLGNMDQFLSDNQLRQPGYEGFINDQVATLPELLRGANYHTYMVGKWHLGDAYDNSPRARGFERSFTLLNGAAGHFDDMVGPHGNRPKASYREDGELINNLPRGFYSSRFYTDKLINYIDSNQGDDKPFFAYAAYTAPHWPIHAPDEVIDKYAGTYDVGYDAIRAQRFNRIKELSLLSRESTFPSRPSFIPAWESLSTGEKRRAAREMEAYAAMVDELDANIGRLIGYLEASDLLENTLIVFLSDNGSDAFSLTNAPDALLRHANAFDNSLNNIGRRNSFSFIGPKWAHVGEAPFRLYKLMSTEGGIRVPAIISYPALGTARGINNTNISVMDVVPTVLELAGVEHPDHYRGKSVHKPDGRSLVPVLTGQQRQVRDDDDIIGYEFLGRRAVIKGNWKILYLPAPIGTGSWELFNLQNDPGEQRDLSEKEPDKLAELISDWARYQEDFGVVLPPPGPVILRSIPLPDR